MAKKKKFPTFKTDKEAADFVATADLSEYDLRGKFVRFAFHSKNERLNMRLPATLLRAIKGTAAAHRLPYQRFIRMVLQQAVQPAGAPKKTG